MKKRTDFYLDPYFLAIERIQRKNLYQPLDAPEIGVHEEVREYGLVEFRNPFTKMIVQVLYF